MHIYVRIKIVGRIRYARRKVEQNFSFRAQPSKPSRDTKKNYSVKLRLEVIRRATKTRCRKWKDNISGIPAPFESKKIIYSFFKRDKRKYKMLISSYTYKSKMIKYNLIIAENSLDERFSLLPSTTKIVYDPLTKNDRHQKGYNGFIRRNGVIRNVISSFEFLA